MDRSCTWWIEVLVFLVKTFVNIPIVYLVTWAFLITCCSSVVSLSVNLSFLSVNFNFLSFSLESFNKFQPNQAQNNYIYPWQLNFVLMVGHFCKKKVGKICVHELFSYIFVTLVSITAQEVSVAVYLSLSYLLHEMLLNL